MNIKRLLTIVGVLAILVAALPVGAAFAQGPSGQNPPLGLGRGNWGDRTIRWWPWPPRRSAWSRPRSWPS